MTVTKAQAQKAEYDRIRAKPFTRVHGRPNRNNLDWLVQETSELLIETRIPGFSWAGEHGLLAEVIGGTQCTAKTTKVYTVPVEPAAYDACITTNSRIAIIICLTCLNMVIKHVFARTYVI